jgi:TRAP-type mannitol/chloroaromatic compound transport system permease small subunit
MNRQGTGAKDMLDKVEHLFQRTSRLLGRILAVVFLLMTINIFYDVVMRYFFHNSSVAMQEMEWHLFSIVILFGVSVALMEEGHVRVDFLYDRFSVRKKAIINIVGTVFFLLPLACLIFFGSFEFVMDSYGMNEISENPGGLPYRWLIKAMIPLAFGILILSAIGYTVKNINLYRRSGKAGKIELHGSMEDNR